MSREPARPARALLLALLGVTALTVSQFAWARSTNFRGFDEWLVLSLLSRGIVSAPYANRPLALAFALPAQWLAPGSLEAILLLHAFYIGAAGFLVFLILREARPRATVLAWLAAAFAIVWSPTDPTRFCSVQMVIYSGLTAAVASAHWLFVRSWTRGSLLLLAAATLPAGLSILTHEAALPTLALAPAWLLVAAAPGRRSWWRWTLPWTGFIGLCAVPLLIDLLSRSASVNYQMSHVRSVPTMRTMLANLGARLSEHALPLFTNGISSSDVAASLLAVSVFVAAYAAFRVRGHDPARPREWLLIGAIGVAWTLLGHLPYAVSTSIAGPSRTQYLSAPGMGVALAALLCGLREWPWRRVGGAISLAMSIWIVAQGTARSVAFQRYWDQNSLFFPQRAALADLLRLAPSVKRDTLIILVGRGSAWKLEPAFRHAVLYLYDGQALGYATAAPWFLYATRFESDGVFSEPDPIIRGPWREPVSRFGYDQLIVVRENEGGGLVVVEDWPADLPALPPGAHYEPFARILPGPPHRQAMRVLGPF